MASTIQTASIDVASWVEDEIYFNYPEGARSKLAFFPPESGAPPFILPKRRYLYKRSDKRYPDQFWGEIVAYQVGGLLGVDVPPAYAALNSKDGDCAALIEWFYEDEKAQFIPGGQYMQRMMPDFDRKRGAQHNFQSVRTLGRAMTRYFHATATSWEEGWADAFLFDALIGNTDRHQDNWGCVIVRRKNATPQLTLSPLFDNGTSLGHERFPHRLTNWTDEDYLRYIRKGTHHIRWQKDDINSCGHVDLLKKMILTFPPLEDRLRQKIDAFDVDQLAPILNGLVELEIPVPLTQDRKNLYIKLIKVRHMNIRAAFG